MQQKCNAIGPSLYEYEFHFNNRTVETQDPRGDSGWQIEFQRHIKEQLKKACAKASTLRRLRKFNLKDVMVFFNKAYVLPHLESLGY